MNPVSRIRSHSRRSTRLNRFVHFRYTTHRILALRLSAILIISICTFYMLGKIEVGESGDTKQTGLDAPDDLRTSPFFLGGLSYRSERRGCRASKHGFIESHTCHPFSLPRLDALRRGAFRPKQTCGLLSPTTAGFCLCDND